MKTKASSFEAVLAELPFVQEELRIDIAGRIEAGEAIAGRDYLQDLLFAQGWVAGTIGQLLGDRGRNLTEADRQLREGLPTISAA